eukprot:scaffold34652_cov211-Amphora_coffeaeformis.AAC.3
MITHDCSVCGTSVAHKVAVDKELVVFREPHGVWRSKFAHATHSLVVVSLRSFAATHTGGSQIPLT